MRSVALRWPGAQLAASNRRGRDIEFNVQGHRGQEFFWRPKVTVPSWRSDAG